MTKNAIYAQSGGVTAVINASALGVIDACRDYSAQIGTLYAAQNGIWGILYEQLFNISLESRETLAGLRHTPGGVFGSCRYRLKPLEQSRRQYQRLIEVFAAYNIGYFFYNGGNDSADTCLKVAEVANELGYPLQAIHIPKTIDNDLVGTHNCPGFGSAAKYVATSILEAGYDLRSMHKFSTKVFILEVMGRNAGWLAAACGVASTVSGEPPHLILFPEVVFAEANFLAKVKETVDRYGYCVIAASEGIKDKTGQAISTASAHIDDFGHQQLGGTAPVLAKLIAKHLGYKQHWAVVDYLQRSSRHLASKVDVEQAYAVGYRGVEIALDGGHAVMSAICHSSSDTHHWEIAPFPLEQVANQEKCLPRDFITSDGYHITQSCREYLLPLISGEDYPPFKSGLPNYQSLAIPLVSPQLTPFVDE